jgi:hypothetical protein
MNRTLTTLVLTLAIVASAALYGCNLGKEAAETTEDGSAGAVSVAEKMSDGTVGDAEESGDE